MTKSVTLPRLSLLLSTILMFMLAGCGNSGRDVAPSLASEKVSTKAAVASEKFVPGELLIQFLPGVSKGDADETLRSHGAAELEEIRGIGVKRIKVPEQALDQVQAALQKNGKVKFVEKNFLADISSIPNDPTYGSQWHLPKISAPAGWDISTGSPEVSIAIIDSGIDPSHSDLSAKLLPGYNFLNATTDTHDVQGHGTKVAGSAAAVGNNGVGVAGVAWKNAILPLVVVDSTGSASYSNIASAITYAVDHGVRIISISIAGTSSSSALENAVTYAWNKGCLVFAGTGNAGTTALSYPAACTKAISVGATDSADNRASFSNYGTWITLTAPGSGIYTTTNGGGYASVSGTSFSTPIAAGLAALILSANPALTNQQVKDIMVNNADDLGTVGYDQYFGFGRINVAKSLTAAMAYVPQPDTMAPTVAFTAPGSGSTVSGAVYVAVSANDNTGVAKVEFYVNGTLAATDNTQPFSFYWDTKAVGDGSYQLSTKAYDAAGNTSTATMMVTVSNPVDTIPPVVQVLSPATGSILGTKPNTTISVSSVDNMSVARTEIYVDGVLQTASASASLSWTWNIKTLAAGNHTIMAKAFDGAGNTATSSVMVTK